MEELLAYLARNLVDRPDEVRVERVERDGAVVLRLHVAEDDVGKVIGRQGRIARALRTLVRASGGRRHERAVLEIVDSDWRAEPLGRGRPRRPAARLAGAFVVEDARATTRRGSRSARRLRRAGASARRRESKRAGGRLVVRLDRRPRAGRRPRAAHVAELPPPGEDAFYVFELVGLDRRRGGWPGRSGRVQDVAPGVANDVLELESGIALPMVEECVRAVDLEGGRILIAPGFAPES